MLALDAPALVLPTLAGKVYVAARPMKCASDLQGIWARPAPML